MAKRRVWRRLFILLGILFLAFLAVVLTAPYWLPPALRYGAARFGVEIGKIERIEEGRVVFHDIAATTELFDLELHRVEAFRPIPWYREVKNPDTNDAPAYLVVDGWSIRIHEDAIGEEKPDKEEKPDRGVYEYYQLAEKYIGWVREWMPKALLLNGSVEFQGRKYTFATITWEKGRLEAAGTYPENAIPMVTKGRFTPDQPWQLSFAMHPLDFRTRLRLSETNGMVHANLATFYKESSAVATADFGREGVIPLKAAVRSEDFKLPADLLDLEGYQSITGDFRANWETNQYTLNLRAHAEPFVSADLPPVDVALAAQGDTNSVRIEELQSNAPGLQASLSNPVELNYKGELLSGPSELRIAADLENLPWLDLKGRIEGTITLEPGEQRFPGIKFEGQGSGLGYRKIEAEALEFEAALDWPVLERAEVRVDFGEDRFVALSGSANLETRVVESASIQAEGAIATNALPPGIRYDSLALNASASGPLTNLSHSGQLELRGFETEATTPLHLEAKWQARQAAFDEFGLLARAGPAALFLAGSGAVTESSTNLLIRSLALRRGDDAQLSLEEPFKVSLQSTNLSGPGPVPLIVVTPLTWRGEGRELGLSARLAWPHLGQVSFAATNINPELFQFFVKRSLSGLDLSKFELNARWNQGPLYASVAGAASIVRPPFGRVAAEVMLDLDGGGLSISHLNVSQTNQPVVTAQGFLPLSVHPLDTAQPVRLATTNAIDFRLETAPNEAFWSTVADLAKLDIEDPFISLNISGTTRQPSGTLAFHLDSIRIDATNRELPQVGPIEGSIVLNEQHLRIPSLRIMVEDEPLQFTANTPLGDDFWGLRRDRMQTYLLTNSTARLRAPKIELASFARFFPEYLAPEGSIHIDAGIEPGPVLAGGITATNISTRPIPAVGVLEEIHARISLEERRVEIEQLAANLGGEALRVAGTIQLDPDRLAAGFPGIHLAIQGTNVPLARNPDVILRSDLDLVVSNAETNPPRISGELNLRESVLLQDITALVPGGVSVPSQRPPYFSIDQELLDDWGLDIRVRGVEFMRVRSPFFQGLISAAFHVTGTLEEPMALGEATIPSGRVLFPFATLGVSQGIVSLSSANPYMPRVFVIAKGRAFGFDITMQAEGPADEMAIEFSSVPSLTSEEIVLLLTTGQIPRSDFAYSNQQRAGKLAFFLGKSLLSKLNPGASNEERLIIRSGEDISEEGRTTYAAEYKLTDRWSLVGEYDRFGDVNAGVKWKILSK